MLWNLRVSKFCQTNPDVPQAWQNVMALWQPTAGWMTIYGVEGAVGLEQSATTALSSGVPQGSILGPRLFGMYVSPTDEVRIRCNIIYMLTI